MLIWHLVFELHMLEGDDGSIRYLLIVLQTFERIDCTIRVYFDYSVLELHTSIFICDLLCQNPPLMHKEEFSSSMNSFINKLTNHQYTTAKC